MPRRVSTFAANHSRTFVLVARDSEVGDAYDRVILMRDGKVLG